MKSPAPGELHEGGGRRRQAVTSIDARGPRPTRDLGPGQLRLARRRDGTATATRDDLIERYMPLARSCTKRFARTSEPIDDLIQVAYFALVKAVDGFDPGQGTAFSSFAVPTIIGELKRHFRDRSWAVRPPRTLQEHSLKVDQATTRLWAQTGRQPTVAEISAHTALSEENVLEALQARRGLTAISLDTPRTTDDGEDATLAERLSALDDGYELAEVRAVLTTLMTALTERDRQILRLRFEEDMTQNEIGKIVGISQMQVSRIIRASIVHLRDAASAAA